MEIREVSGVDVPIELLLEADPSRVRVEAYVGRSRCFVALLESEPVGACVVQPMSQGVYELMNIAVSPGHQQKGIGTELLRHAIAAVRDLGAQRLEVGTGTFGYQLAFYQRAGFRVFAVDRDFFLRNYPGPIMEHGIQLRDMLRLAVDYEDADAPGTSA
jgi:ribosomal protein S18 acetylase RimI-like enzyme